MKIHVLEYRMIAPVPAQQAFAVFENPYNLLRITPSWLNLRVTNPEEVSMRRGAEIHYTIRWLGIPLSWTTVITEYAPPFLFVDEQTQGPYRLWRHRHSFEPADEGTVVSDRVEYALPFGLLGRLVHTLLVARQLRRIFEHRQRALAVILADAPTAR